MPAFSNEKKLWDMYGRLKSCSVNDRPELAKLIDRMTEGGQKQILILLRKLLNCIGQDSIQSRR